MVVQTAAVADKRFNGAATPSRRAADRDRVLEKGDRKILSADCSYQPYGMEARRSQ